MEPAVELAIRIVSHLWILRHAFPRHHNFEELRREDWQAQLLELASGDTAFARQIQDLTTPVRMQVPGRLKSHAAAIPTVQDSVANFARHLEGLADSPSGAGSGDRFPADRLRFRSLAPEEVPAEAAKQARRPPLEDLTRDEVAEELAGLMLEHPALMVHAAETLQYEPVLVQLIRARQSTSKAAFEESGTTGMPAWTDPDLLLALADRSEVPVPFTLVQREELGEIALSRRKRLTLLCDSGLPPESGREIQLPKTPVAGRLIPRQQAFDSCLFGLALSGGGIRSATFALGVLQSMADNHFLPFVDYLSTVSGGGYIGSWMLAWTKRRGSIVSVQDSMRGYASDIPGGSQHEKKPAPALSRNGDPMSDDVRPIRFLREFSRYLAPEAGFFSADTWTILSTWLRNTVLNLIVLSLFLGAVLLAPRTAATLLLRLPGWIPGASALGWMSAVLLLSACVLIAARNLRTFRTRRAAASPSSQGDDEPLIVLSIVSLIFAGAFIAVTALWTTRVYDYKLEVTVRVALVYVVGVLILSLPRLLSSEDSGPQSRRGSWWAVLAIIVSAAAGTGLIAVLCGIFSDWSRDSQRGTWMAITYGLPLILLILTTVVVLFLGVMGRDLAEEQREWWSRLGAWIGILSVVWLATGAICFFSPLWVAKLGATVAAAGITWGAITAMGVNFAYSAASGIGTGDGKQNPLKAVLTTVAPYVFVVGLLVAIAFGLHYGLGRALDVAWVSNTFIEDPAAQKLCCTGAPFTFQRMVDNYWALMYPASYLAPVGFVLLLGFCAFWALRIDVNEFSMHHLYKNRLVRAYLGASRNRQHRWPNAFTGFDLDDDLPLRRLQVADTSQKNDAWTDCKSSFIGPLPIINAALNVSRGDDLGRQERKAESFTFTPLRSGYDFARKQTNVPRTALQEYAFRPTEHYASGVAPTVPLEPGEGISLGTVMAVSGAAANPNSGFHTAPALAFLLTIFNVRLGWWLGNTRTSTWTMPSPRFGLAYLLSDLTAQTNTQSNYVQLTDGGHFDNMGLYELVRRRARFIVVVDGEEDVDFKLEGIGGAIRKCRVDFGAVIDLNLKNLMPAEKTRLSEFHYAVGTVLYSGEEDHGTVVYIKSSLTDDESVDIIEFRKRFPDFPHESTVKHQFFDESHFESYRELGHHVGKRIFSEDALAVFQEKEYDLGATLTALFGNIRSAMEKSA